MYEILDHLPHTVPYSSSKHKARANLFLVSYLPTDPSGMYIVDSRYCIRLNRSVCALLPHNSLPSFENTKQCRSGSTLFFICTVDPY